MTPIQAIEMQTYLVKEINRENGAGDDAPPVGGGRRLPASEKPKPLTKEQWQLMMKDRANYGR